MKVLTALSVLAALVGLQTPGILAQEQPEVRFTQVSRETIENRLRRFDGNNDKREATLKTMFMEAGCGDLDPIQRASHSYPRVVVDYAAKPAHSPLTE